MSTELKPCPFCGGQAKIHSETLDERYAYANVVKVQCKSCGVATSARGDISKPGYADNSTTEKRAAEAWNRRASPAAAVPEGALPPPAAYGYVGLTGHDPRDGHKQLIGVSVQPSGSYMKDREVKLYTEAQLRAAVEADRAQRDKNTHQQDGRDSALRAEPAGRVLSAVADMTDKEVAEICARVRPTDFAGDNGDVDYLRYDAAVVRAVCTELATRCRAEGGDGAPEAGDVSADRAQQGEPVVCAPNCFYGDCPPCVEAGVAPSATKAAAPDDATAEMLDMLGRIHPLAMDDRGDKEGRDKRLYGPVVRQQPLPVPDQACVVWRWDVMQLLSEVKQLRAYKAMNLEAAPVPDTGIPTAGEVEKAGWKWVPDEPTDEMREACRVLNYCDDIDAEWARMLAAAPSHPAEGAKK